MKSARNLCVLLTFLMAILIASQPVLAAQKIDLNTASVSQLTEVNGIGEKMAQRIIDYRNKNKFTKVDDLLKIKGIGEKNFKKISPYFTVGSVQSSKPK